MNSIEFSPAATAVRSRRSRGAGAVGISPVIVKPVVLDRGSLLRIFNGPGTRVVAASGVLWVTEENGLQDHVLCPGDGVRLTHRGKALVFAHERARVVLEVSASVANPDLVEVAPAEGEPGRRIVLARRLPRTASAIAAGLTRALRRAIRWLVACQGFAARKSAPLQPASR